MLPAVLTAFLFACSGVCGQRSAALLGPLCANAIRLLLAMLVLGLAAWITAPVDFTSPAMPWLLLSGLIGFGIGDVALFIAYPHLGARLTLLMNLCLAPVAGALGEWLLLDASVAPSQILCCLVIVFGVGIALSSPVRMPVREGASLGIGLLAAFFAGAGQGLGATTTRMAKRVAALHGDHFTGISEAFVRVIPGFLFAWLVWQAMRRFGRGGNTAPKLTAIPLQRLAWVVGAAMFGPILGVSCFQWALSSASSGVVLSITATTPILIIPMVACLDGERISSRALLGSLVAVTGVVLLIA
jgi:drug/metabolite transporter (DMT)-like permease